MKALLFALALVAAQDQAAGAADPVAPVVTEPPPALAPEATTPPVPTPIVEPQAVPATEPAAVVEAKPEELPFPVGAPTDDYGLVSWCYGALGGYLELHDRVLPEVTRIEGAYRRPGTRLEDDMATYGEMQKISRDNMKLFARAMEAAERASIQPINLRGAVAVQQGRKSWSGAASLSDRTVAQQWMGWALPVRCTPTATNLEARAKLLGTAFKSDDGDTVDPAATPESGPVPDAIPAEPATPAPVS